MDFAKIEEEETEDDHHLSFPVASTNNSPPRFVDSPPLWWHPPSPTFPNKDQKKSEGKEVASEQNCPNKYPFQDFKATSTDKQRQFSSSYYDVDEGEKMDLLWECLNEELISAKNSVVSSPGREVEMICVKVLKLSKTGHDMMSERRLGIFMLFKFFKKVFTTAHYSRNSAKKQHRI